MLATIGIVDCIFRRVSLRPSRFHSCAWGTAVSLLSERDGTERKRHRFFYSYCMHVEVLGFLSSVDRIFAPQYVLYRLES